MELSLIKILHKPTGTISYHAVNDRHYDAMLAGGGDLDLIYDWNWLGDVTITEEILNEQNFFYKDSESDIMPS